MRAILILILVLISFTGRSQTSTIDSLEIVLKTLPEDSNKVKTQCTLALAYHNSNATKTLDLGLEAKELSRKLGFKRGTIESLKMIGIAHWVKGNIDMALKNYREALNLAIQINDVRHEATLYNNMAVVHNDQGEYYIALKLFFDGLRVLEENNIERLIPSFMQNIGDTYKNLEDYDNAILYTEKALELFKDLNNEIGIAVCYNNLGEIFFINGQYTKALEKLNESRKIFVKYGNTRGESITTGNIGDIYVSMKKFVDAKNELSKARHLFTELDNQHGLAYTLNQLGKLEIKEGKNEQALNYFIEAHAISHNAGLKDVERDVLASLAKYYKSKNDYKKALEYYEDHLVLRDSLFNIDKNRQVVELQTLYESEKKERENIQLKEEKARNNQLLKEQEERQKTLVIFLLVTLFLAGMLIYAMYLTIRANRKLKVLNTVVIERNEEIQAQSQELNEAYEEIKSINANLEKMVLSRTEKLNKSNAELSEFLYRASHDLKGPLMTLQGLAYLGIRDGEKKFDEILDKVVKTTDEMNSTLNNLLHVNVVRKGSLTLENIDFASIIKKISRPRSKIIADKNIDLKLTIDDGISFVSDADLIEIILENLIDNGILYSDNQKDLKHVEVAVSSQNESVLVQVKDNGVGIEENQLEKIFEMFYRGNIRSHGNGLGLYIVKVAVENLKGKIEINSEEGEGTVVKMVFPVG